MTKKIKYTYDRWKFDEDGKGGSGAQRAVSLRKIRELLKIYIEKYPKDIHFIIRKPDNKLMNFYHPAEGFGEVLKKRSRI